MLFLGVSRQAGILDIFFLQLKNTGIQFSCCIVTRAHNMVLHGTTRLIRRLLYTSDIPCSRAPYKYKASWIWSSKKSGLTLTWCKEGTCQWKEDPSLLTHYYYLAYGTSAGSRCSRKHGSRKSSLFSPQGEFTFRKECPLYKKRKVLLLGGEKSYILNLTMHAWYTIINAQFIVCYCCLKRTRCYQVVRC